MPMPEMWMQGSTVELQLTAPEGPLFVMPLPLVVLMAQISDGEIVRFTWDHTDPETGESSRGAARLVLQELPDPRDRKTDEGPPCGRCGAPADAHVAWASGHLYVESQLTEEQPPAADATVPAANCMTRAEEHDAHVWALSTGGHFQCDGKSAYAYVRPTTVKSVGPSFRDSGGFPILPPYTPPAP